MAIDCQISLISGITDNQPFIKISSKALNSLDGLIIHLIGLTSLESLGEY